MWSGLSLRPEEEAGLRSATPNYQGKNNDGTQTVSGDTTTGITFPCTFGPHGHKVVS